MKCHRHLTCKFTFDWSTRKLENEMRIVPVQPRARYISRSDVNGYKSSFLCNTIDEIHLARGFTFERNAAQRFITSSYLQTFPKTLQPATCNFSDSLTVKSSSFVSGKWMDLGAERHSYFVQQRETTGRVYDIAVSFDSCGCDPAIFVSERRWFLFAANPR